jgi:hypothetical protein
MGESLLIGAVGVTAALGADVLAKWNRETAAAGALALAVICLIACWLPLI